MREEEVGGARKKRRRAPPELNPVSATGSSTGTCPRLFQTAGDNISSIFFVLTFF